MTTEITQEPVQENPALVKLSSIENNVEIADMNYLFHYAKVNKPNGGVSNLFALHYKEAQQTTWDTCKRLLTSDFTVAKTEQVISQIQQNLSGTMMSERHYRSNTSVSSSFTLSGYQIDIPEESEVDLILFKLMTNIAADIQVLTTSALTFNIINGFSGNHALSLTFGVMKTMRTTLGNDERIVPVNNVFLLDKFTKRLIHNAQLSVSIEDVTNVQRAVTEQVRIFKSHPMNQLVMDNINSKLPKKFVKRFIALYDNLPTEFRNFYYCSYIWSVLLDSEKNIDLEIKIRDLVRTEINILESATTAI